jgi:oxygen-dependent protoporphyrinogen oxidase
VLPARRDDRDESLAEFFSRRFGREVFERLVEPLMAGIYAGDAAQMSLQATFPRFRELERRHGSIIRGVLAGRKTAVPASPSQPGRPSRTMFVTLRQGLSSLTEALTAHLRKNGATLMAGQRVSGVRRLSGSPVPGYRIDLADGRMLNADGVVLATPAYVSAGLLRPWASDAADQLAAIPYASTATVSLAYDQPCLGAGVQGYGFVVPRVEGRALIAATWSSLKWPHRAASSRSLVRCYLGGAGRESVVEEDDAAIRRIVERELREIAGIDAAPSYVEVARWRKGMPQYVVGHLQRLERLALALRATPGFCLTGAAYRGVGIPDCIKDGTDTAHAMVKFLNAAQA